MKYDVLCAINLLICGDKMKVQGVSLILLPF